MSEVRRINLFSAETEPDAGDPEGYRALMRRFGPEIGASMMGGSIYELPPGQSVCPYHYEYGNEEWAIGLVGTVTLRHPGGEMALAPGDVVCFPPGPDGAHKLTNAGEETVRVLLLSTMKDPDVTVYPDSDKIGVYPGGERDKLIVRRASGVDYFEGEA